MTRAANTSSVVISIRTTVGSVTSGRALRPRTVSTISRSPKYVGRKSVKRCCGWQASARWANAWAQ